MIKEDLTIIANNFNIYIQIAKQKVNNGDTKCINFLDY